MDKDTIVVGRWAEFHKDHPQVNRLKAQMTMKNPEYEKNERLGFPNVIVKYDKDGNVVGREEVPKIIQLFQQVGDRVLFPRAVVHPLMGKQGVHIVDRTTTGERVEFPSLIKLRPHQEPFVDKLEAALRSQYGAVGQAEAGFGKTVCSLELMSRLGLKTVILVHKEFLMTQWIHRMLGTKAAAHFLGVRPSELSDKIEPPMLGIEPEDIGIVLQGRCEWEDKKVVVAMVQSLTSGREYPEEFYESFGLVMVDECVHGDTEVLTCEGYRRAADVYADWVAGRPIQLLVPTPTGMVAYPVTHAWEREKLDSVVVETKTGERIRVSREHEFRVVDAALRLSWKRADELRPGDYIVSPRRPIDSSPRLFDREGYFLGLFVGDGHYLSEGKVRFTVRKDVEAWRKALVECGVSYRESTNARGDVSFVVEGEAVEWVRRMGFRPGRKAGRIGWLGLTYGRSDAWTVSFLRGLFDTEGSVISDRVQLSMTDETLLREVHRTLRLLGIEGKLVLRSRTNPKHRDVTQISLFGPAARTFFDVVGFGFDRKRQTEMLKGKAGDGVFVGQWLDALASAGLKYGYLSEISGIHRSKLEPSGPQRLSHACVRRLIRSVGMYLDTLDTSSWDEVNRYKLVTYEMVAEAVGTSTASVWREPERFKDTYQRLAEQRVRSLRRVLEQASWVQTAWIEVVRSVEGAPGGKFYDFEVPVEHRFVANGLEVHNCHRFAAPVFRQSIVKFPAAKRLGVTATPKRNDGLEPVFFAHIGQIAAVGKGDRAKPRVNRIQTPVRATPAIHRKMKVRGRENLSRIINFLVDYDARNRQIVRLLVKAAESGRKILVLSHRVAHVEELRRQFIEACRTKGLPVSTAYYIGGMDLKERANAEKMQVLFATYQMSCVALDQEFVDGISGDTRTFREVIEDSDDLEVTSVDPSTMRFSRSAVGARAITGRKECVKLSVWDSDVTVSLDHQVLTQRGWVPAGEVRAGKDYLVRPRKVEVDETPTGLTADELWLIGALIGDGNLTHVHRGVAGVTTGDPEMVFEIGKVLRNNGMRLVHKYGPKYRITGSGKNGRGVKTWLRRIVEKYDLSHRAEHKRLPQAMMEAPVEEVAHLLAGLIDSDGCVSTRGSVSFTTTSKRLARQVVFLFSRLGIVATLREQSGEKGKVINGVGVQARTTYTVVLPRSEEDTVLGMVPLRLTRKWERLVTNDRSQSKLTVGQFNKVPPAVVDELKDMLRGAGVRLADAEAYLRTLQLSGSWLRFTGREGSVEAVRALTEKYGLCPEWCSRVTGAVWLPVKAVERVGVKEVGDISVPGARNYVVGGVVVHNSEGLDIPALDTIFLATPVGDVEQAVGRILRKHSEKMTPVVVDFVDTAFKMTTGLADKRKREYEAKGWLN